MKWLKITLSVLSISVIATVLVVKQQVESYMKTPMKISEPRELWVERGASMNGTLNKLARQGDLIDVWKFKLYLKLYPEHQNLQKGVYQLTPKDTPLTLITKLNTGDVKKYRVTLIEGHTIQQWLALLQRQPRLEVDNDIFEQVLKLNGDTSGKPEGKFFPDTYQYTSSTKLLDILNQSYKKMQTELQKIWDNRAENVQVNSPYELLILASIIEKETAKPSERDVISAVFNNRLSKKMRLQTDPTVIYGMGERFKGNITRKDLREKTPFNTYRINGLPPTPIAAPSLASIQAAAHPADVNYLYFVSRNDGSHIFSRTLRQHNRAVNQYQRNRK
ncbi:endolytic transglycosylase MltG [Parashewanella curva]|uniref:Endolytic murein transglycosylase n=1 Tax=Parashewanella curva TaxID=2338552 RepID=A0A3L8Q2H5_9GAMM|nr:endolytic transglycosylase MltG [Parashewanella curva]RLV61118.1 endolytic transglycosylase MltG [Parashewanella curva]